MIKGFICTELSNRWVDVYLTVNVDHDPGYAAPFNEEKFLMARLRGRLSRLAAREEITASDPQALADVLLAMGYHGARVVRKDCVAAWISPLVAETAAEAAARLSSGGGGGRSKCVTFKSELKGLEDLGFKRVSAAMERSRRGRPASLREALCRDGKLYGLSRQGVCLSLGAPMLKKTRDRLLTDDRVREALGLEEIRRISLRGEILWVSPEFHVLYSCNRTIVCSYEGSRAFKEEALNSAIRFAAEMGVPRDMLTGEKEIICGMDRVDLDLALEGRKLRAVPYRAYFAAKFGESRKELKRRCVEKGRSLRLMTDGGYCRLRAMHGNPRMLRDFREVRRVLRVPPRELESL